MAWEFREVRTIFLSDFHLGFPGGRMLDLRQFLEATPCENLYLLGDIVDGVNVNHISGWSQAQRDILDTVLAGVRRGMRVFYTPGNHDSGMRGLHGRSMMGVSVEPEFVYHSQDGRRFLATHGDHFDYPLNENRLKYRAGAWGYALAGTVDRARGRLQRKVTGESRSWCRWAKDRYPGLRERFSDFEATAVAHARKRGFDGVICGHTHTPNLHEYPDGFVYLNTGDWLDHCSAVVEHLDGRMSLVSWDSTFTCFKGRELNPALA